LAGQDPIAEFCFTGEAFVWRGPAPYLFVTIPEEFSGELRFAAHQASYGWGVIPVEVTIAGELFTTSLFPRENRYLLPIKMAVQRATNVGPGSSVRCKLVVRPR
jgi:hypothetical protein